MNRILLAAAIVLVFAAKSSAQFPVYMLGQPTYPAPYYCGPQIAYPYPYYSGYSPYSYVTPYYVHQNSASLDAAARELRMIRWAIEDRNFNERMWLRQRAR